LQGEVVVSQCAVSTDSGSVPVSDDGLRLADGPGRLPQHLAPESREVSRDLSRRHPHTAPQVPQPVRLLQHQQTQPRLPRADRRQSGAVLQRASLHPGRRTRLSRHVGSLPARGAVTAHPMDA